MKNWKTTLFGALTALGLWAKDQPGWVGVAGQVITFVAPVALGVAAKDHNVPGPVGPAGPQGMPGPMGMRG